MKWVVVVLILWILILTLSAQDNSETVIEIAESITVLLAAESPTTLTYTTGLPQYVTITTRSLGEPDAIDTVIRVLDPDGRQLAYADNGVDRNAVIENLWLPAAGDYTMLIDSFNGVSAGEVQVTLTLSDPFNAEIETDDTTITINATLPRSGRFVYPLAVVTDDTLSITARDTSLTLDPVLWLLNADGAVLFMNDDHLQPSLTLDVFDAEIVDYRAEADGMIQVIVTDFLGHAGTFELVIRREN